MNCENLEKAFESIKFFNVDQNVDISLNAFSLNMKFLRLAVFKILQFELIIFLFRQCCHFVSTVKEK